MGKERFFTIIFPETLVREPVLYSLVKRYGLAPSVYKASVTGSGGWLVVKLSGDNGKIDEAILDLKCRGAQALEGGGGMMENDTPSAVSSVRVRLTIPQARLQEPVYNKMTENHDVVINIRQANITSEGGVVDMEISGALTAIDGAIEMLKNDGVEISPVEGNVIE